MNIYTLNSFHEIEALIGKSNVFADRIGNDLPFNRIQLPLLWFKYFSSKNGLDFGTSRGRNFLGLKSWLLQPCFIIAEKNEELVGIAPFFKSRVLLKGSKDTISILSLCPDSGLIFYQDLLIDPEQKTEVISEIFRQILKIIESENLILFMGHIPETSTNIAHYRALINSIISKGWAGGETVNQWRPGAYPWNLDKICYNLQSISNNLSGNDNDLKNEIEKLIDTLKNQTTALMLFVDTRKKIEEKIIGTLKMCEAKSNIDEFISNISSIFDVKPIIYPYLTLPENSDSFFSSLSSSKRYFFRRYTKKFINAGGIFENISPENISHEDVEDYIALHSSRWKNKSAAVIDQTLAFHKELSMIMAQKGYFRLFFARYNEKRIAALSCFDIADRREFYYSGRSLANKELRAGKLLVLHSILDAIEKGFKIFDFGYGGDDYKFDFTNEYKILRSFFLTKENTLPNLHNLFPMYEQIVL